MHRLTMLIFALLLLSQTLIGQEPPPRTWTDATGKFKTEATLVSRTETTVTLKKTATRDLVTIPLNKLSAADQQYLKENATTSDSKSTQGRTLTADEVAALQKLAKENNGSVEIKEGAIVGVSLGAIKSNVLAQFRDLHTVNSFGTYLSYSTLNDEDLAVIGSMKNLESIDLDACQINGLKGLSTIAKLPKLKSLAIGEGGVDDAEVAVINQSKSIRELSLYAHSLSDKGLKHIGEMTELTTLKLQGSPEYLYNVTDAGVAHLTKLTKLEHLDLSRIEVTDACIDSIAKLSSLKVVVLGDTKITKAGRDKLQAASPKLEIKDLDF